MVLGLHCRARGVWQKVWFAMSRWQRLKAVLIYRPDDTASGRGAGLRLRRLTPAGVAQGGLGPALPGQGCLAKSLAGDMRVITVQAC